MQYSRFNIKLNIYGANISLAISASQLEFPNLFNLIVFYFLLGLLQAQGSSGLLSLVSGIPVITGVGEDAESGIRSG